MAVVYQIHILISNTNYALEQVIRIFSCLCLSPTYRLLPFFFTNLRVFTSLLLFSRRYSNMENISTTHKHTYTNMCIHAHIHTYTMLYNYLSTLKLIILAFLCSLTTLFICSPKLWLLTHHINYFCTNFCWINRKENFW